MRQGPSSGAINRPLTSRGGQPSGRTALDASYSGLIGAVGCFRQWPRTGPWLELGSAWPLSDPSGWAGQAYSCSFTTIRLDLLVGRMRPGHRRRGRSGPDQHQYIPTAHGRNIRGNLPQHTAPGPGLSCALLLCRSVHARRGSPGTWPATPRSGSRPAWRSLGPWDRWTPF